MLYEVITPRPTEPNRRLVHLNRYGEGAAPPTNLGRPGRTRDGRRALAFNRIGVIVHYNTSPPNRGMPYEKEDSYNFV